MNTATTDKALVPYIRTYSGKQYRHAAPDPKDVCIEDIAHALSQICRFTGHTKKFYSVAEHCVRGSYFCTDPFAFLMHDASEAYYSDINRPLKYLPGMSNYVEYEEQGQNVIEERFGFPKNALRSDAVKIIDNRMLVTEILQLMPNGEEDISHKLSTFPPLDIEIMGWNPELAEKVYLDRFYELKRT